MLPKMRLALSALLLQAAVASPAEDEVVSLPGYDGELPSRQFSGFVSVDPHDERVKAMDVHYLLVEHEGAAMPAGEDLDGKVPLLLWTNGGPGASSMFGLLGEVGPFMLNDDSLGNGGSTTPQLLRNPSTWAKLAHLVIFDWPPPVGFSFCDGDALGGGDSCGDWDDTRMAQVSAAALRALLETKFPELRDSPLYLSGESYAGVYVPKLAQQILDDKAFAWKLRGFAVGDACAGTEVVCGANGLGPWWDILFLYGHGQLSTKLFDAILGACGMDRLKYDGAATDASACDAALGRVDAEVGGYYVYGLYDDCTYENGISRRRRRRELRGAVNDYACGSGAVQAQWLSLPEVRKALHIAADANFLSGDNGEGLPYATSERNLMPFYRDVISKTDVRVLVYNGDADPAINSFQAQNWTAALAIPEAEPWRPWTVDGCRRMGGYVTRYDGDFDFLTIRGAPHMVPQAKAEAAYEFMRAWLSGEPYKAYDPRCAAPAVERTEL